jgi:hypothetical protein
VGNSRGELEELRLFEPVVEGDPGGSDLLVEGQVASLLPSGLHQIFMGNERGVVLYVVEIEIIVLQ